MDRQIFSTISRVVGVGHRIWCDPLLNIPRHIVRTIRACSGWMLTNRRIRETCPLRCPCVSPGIDAPVCATCRFLPLRFSRKKPRFFGYGSKPFGIGKRVPPGDVYYWSHWLRQLTIPVEWLRDDMRFDGISILGNSHRKLSNLKCKQHNCVLWHLILTSMHVMREIRSHEKGASRNFAKRWYDELFPVHRIRMVAQCIKSQWQCGCAAHACISSVKDSSQYLSGQRQRFRWSAPRPRRSSHTSARPRRQKPPNQRHRS